MSSKRIKIDETYTYVFLGGRVFLLRNGIPWLGGVAGFPGSKAWIAAANEIEDLRVQVTRLEELAAARLAEMNRLEQEKDQWHESAAKAETEVASLKSDIRHMDSRP